MCQCRARVFPEGYIGNQIVRVHDIVEWIAELLCYIVIVVFDDGTTADALAVAAWGVAMR